MLNVDEPPCDIKGVGCLVILGKNQRSHSCQEGRKLYENRVYLKSCSYFHEVITKKHLCDVKTDMMRLKEDFNAGTTYYKCKSWWQGFHMWIVEYGITNLLSIPQLEVDGFTIDYNTKHNWVVTTPNGEEILFKKETGKC